MIIPDYVKGELDVTFAGSDRLKSVTIGNGITGIYQIFNNCINLESVIIGDNVRYLNMDTFYNCHNLKEVDISGGVNYVGRSTFKNCSGLKNVIIGSQVSSLEGELFENCDSLETITIKTKVNELESKQYFTYCKSLKTIYCIKGSYYDNADLYAEGVEIKYIKYTPYSVEGGNIYYDDNGMIAGADKSVTRVIIPSEIDGVKIVGIDCNTFKDCTLLTDIVMPNSLKNIRERAFDGCVSVTQINLPSSVSGIGKNAFINMNKLKKIEVQDGNTNYKTINDALLTFDGRDFVACPAGITGVYIIPNGVENIKEFAFYECNNITRLVVPEGVKNIYECSIAIKSLEELVLPESLVYIDNWATDY